MKKLRLGIPKGSLQETTIAIFKKAGFNIIENHRSYKPIIDDDEIECLLIRAQEIPRYVEEGVLDVGLTGKDWIMETKADIEEVAELVYAKQGLGKVKLVVAVPENSPIKNIKQLDGKRIATELVNVTKDYLSKNKIKADVEFSWGSTEIKTPDLVDAIAELSETGSSLKANNLRVIDTIMESTTRVIANKKTWKDEWKKQKIQNIVMLLKGALVAEEKVGLKMHIEDSKLEALLKLLPALRKPTISPLEETGWLAVEVIIEEKKVRNLIPELKKVGVEGIVEYPLNKIIE